MVVFIVDVECCRDPEREQSVIDRHRECSGKCAGIVKNHNEGAYERTIDLYRFALK